jgi:hypothetical protein
VLDQEETSPQPPFVNAVILFPVSFPIPSASSRHAKTYIELLKGSETSLTISNPLNEYPPPFLGS